MVSSSVKWGLQYHQDSYHLVDSALGLACLRPSANLSQDHEARASHMLSVLAGWAPRVCLRGPWHPVPVIAVISVNHPLDYEQIPNGLIYLTVMARDAGNPPLNSTVPVTIEVFVSTRGAGLALLRKASKCSPGCQGPSLSPVSPRPWLLPQLRDYLAGGPKGCPSKPLPAWPGEVQGAGMQDEPGFPALTSFGGLRTPS